MRKKFFIFSLFFIILSNFVIATTYDDFESGTLNAWTVTGTGVNVKTNGGVNDSYSASTYGTGILNSNNTLPTYGEWIVEYYAYANHTAADSMQNYFKQNDGTTCFFINKGYTGSASHKWGYNVGAGWVDTGVLDNSGVGDVEGNWLRLRFIIDNNNGDISWAIGNTDSVTVSNYSYGAGCTDVNNMTLQSTGENNWYDNVRYWNYTKYGWNGTEGSIIVSQFEITASDLLNNSITLQTLNATIEGVGSFTTTNGTIATSVLQNATQLYNISVSGECGTYFCNYSTATYQDVNVSQNLLSNLTYWYYSSTSFTSPVFENENQVITLRINHSNESFNHYIKYVDAILTYNGNIYSPTEYSFTNYTIFNYSFTTPSVNSSQNISFNWVFNLSRAKVAGAIEVIDNFTINVSNQQQVLITGIDNCSTYTTRAVNFTLLNESNDLKINGTLGGYFEVWVSAQSSYRNFNLSWGTSEEFGICINEPTASYIASAQMEYAATGFTTETYYFTNTTLDNTTDLINLYLSDSSTSVLFTITDENDIEIQGAYLHILAYDLATDSSTTTEILKTSTDGTAIGQIVLNTQRYKFIVIYGGSVVFESSDIILTASTYNIRVTLGTNYFVNYNVIKEVSCILTYDNDTRTFDYTFADATGGVTKGCIDITRQTGSTYQTVNSSCLSAASGSISIVIAQPTGVPTYVGTGSVYIDGEQFVCGNSTSFSYDRRYESYGLSGIFISFFIVLALALVGVWSPPIAVLMTLLGLIVVNIFGLFFMNWTALISIIILGGIAIYKLSLR